MKNLSLLIAAVSCQGMASAAQAGFTGPSAAEKTTVSQVKEMPDESVVILQGVIESSLGDEKYMFKDETGSIKVEIDDEDWNGLNVGPNDKIQIQGEVDTHMMKPTEIEVETVTLVK